MGYNRRFVRQRLGPAGGVHHVHVICAGPSLDALLAADMLY